MCVGSYSRVHSGKQMLLFGVATLPIVCTLVVCTLDQLYLYLYLQCFLYLYQYLYLYSYLHLALQHFPSFVR